MDWAELKARKPLDPKTPAEFVEAMRRFLVIFVNEWDNLPDGDGETESPDDEVQTKTDIFMVIQGCSSYALDTLKNINRMEKSLSNTPDRR